MALDKYFKEASTQHTAFFTTFHSAAGIVSECDDDNFMVMLLKMLLKLLTYPWQGREGLMAGARTCERGKVTRWGSKSGSLPWWSSLTRRGRRSTPPLFPHGSSSAGSSACPLLPHRKLTFSPFGSSSVFRIKICQGSNPTDVLGT